MAALYDFNHQPEKWNLSIQVEGIISTTRQDRPDIHQWGGSTASTSCPSHIHDHLPVYASHWWSIEDSISSHRNWGKKNYSNSSIPQDTSVWWWVTFLIIYPLPFIVADIKPFYYTCYQRRRHIYALFEHSLTGSLPLVSPLDMSLGEWLPVTGLLPIICQWYFHFQNSIEHHLYL